MDPNLPRAWHLCPIESTARIPAPPANDLFIGAIIRSKLPKDFRRPINLDGRPNIPSGYIKEDGPYRTSHALKKEHTGNVGFSMTLAQLFNIGPQASYDWTKGRNAVFEFEEERNRWLDIPNKDLEATRALFEDAVTASATVQKFKDARKAVFMVTGLKWVSGIKVKLQRKKEKGGEVGLAADFTATGAPIGAEVSGGGSSSTEETHSSDGGAPFVFCVRLVKLQWNKSSDLSFEDVQRGAYMGVGKSSEDEEAPILTVSDATVEDFEDSGSAQLVDLGTGLEDQFVYSID